MEAAIVNRYKRRPGYKRTIEELKAFAKEKGGDCLSVSYIDNKTKYKWQCGCGFIWEAVLTNVFFKSRWCPKCKGGVRFSMDNVREFEKTTNIRCVSEIYVNAREHLLWKCTKGHTWSASFDNVSHGSGCPVCDGCSKGVIVIEEYLKSRNIPFSSEKCFPDCKYRKALYFDFEIEIHDKPLIEFDGQQHFEPKEHYGGMESFKHQISRDLIKYKYCLENKRRLIRIAYDDDIESILNLLLANSHIKIVMCPRINLLYQKEVGGYPKTDNDKYEISFFEPFDL